MEQLNVRNIDDALWAEVKRRAREAGLSAGECLNRILAEWIDRQGHTAADDARQRAARGRGILKDLAPGASFTRDLHALRQLELERERRQ